MYVFLAILVAMVAVGFVAGATLGAALVNEARRVEKRVREEFVKGLMVVHNVTEEGRAKLEKDTKDSFETVSKDVENIVKRLENIEHAALSKVASIMAPDAPRA